MTRGTKAAARINQKLAEIADLLVDVENECEERPWSYTATAARGFRSDLQALRKLGIILEDNVKAAA